MNNEKVTVLLNSGFSVYEARILAALSHFPRTTAKVLTQLSEVPKNKVYETLENLKSQAVIEELPTKPKQYRCVDLARSLKGKTEQKRAHLAALEQQFGLFVPAAAEKDDAQKFWVVEGVDSMIQKILGVLPKIKKESIGYIDVWTAPDENLKAVEKAIARGVKFYFLGTIDETSRSYARKYANLGVEIRHYDTVGAGYSLFDKRYVQLRVSNHKVISLWIDNPYLAGILREHFFQMWKKGKKIDLS